MKKRGMAILAALSILCSCLPMQTKAAQKGDGWDKWSDYVDESTVIIYPVEGGNIYLGRESGYDEKGTLSVLSADSTVTSARIPATVQGQTVTGFSEFAFAYNTQLKSVYCPDTIQWVWGTCFEGCTSLEELYIPEGASNAYVLDDVLYNKSVGSDGGVTLELYLPGKQATHFSVPEGVSRIESGAFQSTGPLQSISIPVSVTYIDRFALESWYTENEVRDLYYAGTEKQWNSINGKDDVPDTIQVHFNSLGPAVQGGIQVFCDHKDFRQRKGNKISLCAAVFDANGQPVSGKKVDCQVVGDSVLELSQTGMTGNCRYFEFWCTETGTATVVFSETDKGYIAQTAVEVYEDNYTCYTLDSVPTQYIEKYPTNIYNVNGLYVDSYTYSMNDDLTANISFDVYNTNYTYATAEVYDENGKMKDAVLIEKMTSSSTSIKKVLWDGVGFIIRDLRQGDFLTYRQETGYSKYTHVELKKVPRNGYVKIATDPQSSVLVGLVNSVDMLMALSELSGEIKNFKVDSKIFSEKLTKKLVKEKLKAQLLEDEKELSQKLWKNVGKEIVLTSKGMGNFCSTIANSIDEMNLTETVAETAIEFGVDIGESVFIYFSGPVGVALNTMFTSGKVVDILRQQDELMKLTGCGSIYIQNQGGGLRACQQVKVESQESFSADTALEVYTLSLDPGLMGRIEAANPQVHEVMTKGNSYTYNITLVKSGQETQPNGPVKVYIPIPEDIQKKVQNQTDELSNIAEIYRVEQDGTMTPMNAKLEGDFFVFTTEHFSLYTIVDFKSVEENKKGVPTSVFVILTVAVTAFGVIWLLTSKKSKQRF